MTTLRFETPKPGLRPIAGRRAARAGLSARRAAVVLRAGPGRHV